MRMRAYADTALQTWESAVRDNPDEPGNRMALGVTLGLLGRKADAIREGERAVAIRGNDGFQARPCATISSGSVVGGRAGQGDRAAEALEAYLYMISPGWLRVDPSLESPRRHPWFQRPLAVADSLAR